MKKKFFIRYAARSDKGSVRENNEDNLFVAGKMLPAGGEDPFAQDGSLSGDSFVCAVCDGMGGQNSGEVASYEAVTRFGQTAGNRQFLTLPLSKMISSVQEYLGSTNTALFKMANKTAARRGMGTTFACALASGGQAVAVHAGDSRVYMYSKGKLTQLTRDHSESERMVRLGVLTPEEARRHKSRHALNRHLGMPPEAGLLEGDVSPAMDLQSGDILLLCSDGLTDMVEQAQLEEVLFSPSPIGDKADRLIAAALKNGGRDKVTVLMMEVCEKKHTAMVVKPWEMIRKHWYPISVWVLLLLLIILILANIHVLLH